MKHSSTKSGPALLCSGVVIGLVLAASTPARAADKAPLVYACQGFGEPMHRDNIRIGRGRVLPLRARLALPDGAFGETLKSPPKLHLKYRPESGPEVDKTAGLEVRDFGKGNRFVFDREAHWKFDLGTGNLAEDGTYVVSLLSGDEKEYRVDPVCSLSFLLAP